MTMMSLLIEAEAAGLTSMHLQFNQRRRFEPAPPSHFAFAFPFPLRTSRLLNCEAVSSKRAPPATSGRLKCWTVSP